MTAPHWFKRLKFSQKLKPQKILTEIERKDRRSCWFEDLVYWQHPSWSLRGLHTRHSSQISVVKRSCRQAWAKFHRDSTRVFYLNLVQVHHEKKKLHDDFRFCEHYFVTWYGISETTWTKKYFYRSLGAFVPLNCKRSIHFYARRPLKCTVQHACYPTRIYFWPGPKKWHSGYPATSRAALRIGEHPTTVLRIRGVIRQRRGMPLRIRGAIRPPRCRWGYEGPSDMSATWSAVEDTRGYAPKKTQPCPTQQTCQSFEFLLWELGYKGRRSIRYTSDYILDATTTGSSPKRFRKITHLVAFSWGHGIPVGKSKMLANIIEDICAVEVRWKLGPFFFQWQASLSFFWAF